MVIEIVEQITANLKEELKKFPEITYIDCFDIFPKSENERKILNSEMKKLGKVFDEDSKGNFYLLNKPIKTQFRNIDIIKIRIFDGSRLQWRGHPDFKVRDYEIFKNKYGQLEKFKLIKGLNYEMLEYINGDKLLYFPDILLSEDTEIIKKINNASNKTIF